MRNPFTPNFGQVPVVLAGRDQLIDEVLQAFYNAPGDPSLTSILIGARGTGKTALLSLLAGEAQSRGWLVVNAPCIEGLLENIVQGAARAASHLIDSEPSARPTALTLGQLVGVEWERDKPAEPTWYIRMCELLDKLKELGIGLLITVDEVRPNLPEMVELASYYQLFVRDEHKIALLMAGLPSQVSALVSNDILTLLRRASQYHLGRIDAEDAKLVFQETAEQYGKSFSSPALELASGAADGFPFMMQLVGYRSWQAAGESAVIGEEAVRQGIPRASADMKARVLRSTLDELSDGDLAFLEAMLEDERVSLSSDVARRMGKSDSYASQYRSRLIERGIIGARGRGRVGFELPMLREYLPEYLEGRF